MAFLDTKHQRAALVIIALGAVVLWSLGPYATGIIGIPVLAVLFAPLQDWLVKRGAHTGLASLAVTLLGAVLLIVPGLVLAGLLFVGWLTYLAVQAWKYRTPPVVVSRAQLLVAKYDVVAEVVLEDKTAAAPGPLQFGPRRLLKPPAWAAPILSHGSTRRSSTRIWRFSRSIRSS